MNIDVPLSDRHLQVFKELLKNKLRKSWQTWLGKNVFYLSQEQVHRLLNGEVKTTEITYRHLSRLIENLNDDESKPFRNILAEYVIHEICAEPPKLDTNSFPFKCKINLPGDMTMLRKYLVIRYLLQDFEEDIGLLEDIIVPDMDNQSHDYFEGFISASVYLLYIIEEILYMDEDSFGKVASKVSWFIELMKAHNKIQWLTAFDKDKSTEYDTMMCSQDEWISDSALLQSSPSLQDVLVQFCPGRQTKLFYIGWYSFCKYLSRKHFNIKDEDLLLHFVKNKYRILYSPGYCMDKFLEKYHPDDYNKLKNTYNFYIPEIKINGYKKFKEKFVYDIEKIYGTNNMEYILLCFSDKVKGIRVVINLLFSNKYLIKSYPSEIGVVQILFEQVEAVEKDLIAQFKKTNRGKNYYGFLQEIFIHFLEDKNILDSFVKDRRKYRNMPQMYIILAFSGMIVAYYQSSIFKIKNVDDSQNDAMEQYIEDNDTLMSINQMFSTSRQPVLLKFLHNIICESDQIEIGLFTGGEQLGDCAKRFEIMSDLSFIINFLNVFYFEQATQENNSTNISSLSEQ